MDKQSIPARVGYLLKSYPTPFDRFVGSEILALERNGIAVTTYCLQPSLDNDLLSCFGRVSQPIQALGDIPWKISWLILFVHSWGILWHPWRYFKTGAFLVFRKESGRFRDLIHALHLSVAMKRHRIQHLHVYGCGEPASVAEIACELAGICFSISVQARDFFSLQQPATRRKLAKPSFITTSCDYDRRCLQALNTLETPVHRVYQGLDAEWFDASRVKLASPGANGSVSILCIGELAGKMGFDCLIKACAHLKAAGYRFQCNIVGTGPDQESLQNLLRDYELERFVHLRGHLSPALLKAVFQRTNVFVLPYRSTRQSERHDIPAVLLQAMAMALPVVSTKVPVISEVIQHEKNGVLVEPDSGVSLARALIEVFENKPLRKRLGDAGQSTVERLFHIERNVLSLKKHLLHGLTIDESLNTHKLLSAE